MIGSSPLSSRLLIGAAALACAALVALPLAAGPAQAAGGAPQVLYGSFAGAGEHMAVTVYVLPDPSHTNSARTGARYRLYRLPLSAVHVDGANYSVDLAPSSLPPEVKSADGLVTLEVVATNPDTARLGVSIVSARYAGAADGATWSDAIAQPPPVVAQPAAAVETGTSLSGVLLNGSIDSAPARHTLSRAAVAQPYSTIQWGERRTEWAVIGSGFPAGSKRSWMHFENVVSQSYSSVLGVAVGYSYDGVGGGVSYSQRGTRGLDRGYGFTWARSGAQRQYEVGITYRYAVIDLWPNGVGPRYIHEWVPKGYSGGTWSRTHVKRPGWNRCAYVDTGRWTRNQAGRHSFHTESGVHAFGVSGGLSSTRAYNHEAELTYGTHRGYRVCGKNYRPAYAGKIMERT